MTMVRGLFPCENKQGNKQGNNSIDPAKFSCKIKNLRRRFEPHQPPHLIQVSSSSASLSRRPFSFLERLSRAAHDRADIPRIGTRQLMLRGLASRHSASPSSCLTRLRTPPSPRPYDHARGSLQRVDAHTPTTDGREPTAGREASCPRAWRSRRPRPPLSHPRLKRLQARGNSLRCPSRRRTADRLSRDAGR